MYSYEERKQSYEAICEWLIILNQFDRNYLLNSIASYKSRRIQQKAVDSSSYSRLHFDAPGTGYLEIESRESDSAELSESFAEIDNKEKNNLHAMELMAIIEQQQSTINNLSEGLDALSEKINYILDDEDDNNLIDFFK